MSTVVAPEKTKKNENPSADRIKQIYSAAREASGEIRALSIPARLAILKKLRELIAERKEAIIDHIQRDTRKSRSDAMFSEIFGILEHIEFLEKNAAAVLADRKAHTPTALMGKKSKVYFEPLGVVLIISPWNYPFYQAIVPITTSFITGNATVYKPSELTPLTGLVERTLADAGFKPDWAQVVYGEGQTGVALINERPNKIFFTGSVRTGKAIMAQAAQYLIPVELELGGKDPMVVFEDVKIPRAVKGAVWGAMTNTGQSCTSVERLLIQESIYNEFRDAVVKEVLAIKQEVDSDGDADIGGMSSQTQIQIVREQLEDARAKGATVLTGGDWDGKSDMIPPIVLENVTPDMKVHNEETFGPILPIYKFKDEADAIRQANDSEYGLSASVWSADKKRCERVARAIETGNVSVNNVMLTEGNHALPFGGTKQSGIGRYKGEWGLYSFSNIKAVLYDSNSNKLEANWFPYTKRKYQIFSRLVDGLFAKGHSFLKFAVNGLKLESYSGKVGKGGRAADKA